MRTIRYTTLQLLENFAEVGGQIIVAGSDASLVDVELSTRPRSLSARRVPFTKIDILQELQHVQDLRILLDSGMPADTLLYQMRADGEDRYLFICNTDRVRGRQCRVHIRGHWHAVLLDTLTGKTCHFETTNAGDWTQFSHLFNGCGSLLLRLLRNEGMSLTESPENMLWRTSHEIFDCITSLSEPNVLLLDIASHRLDGSLKWEAPEEILRIDNIAREKLGLRLKKDSFAQPWATPKRAPKNTISLKFEFHSDIDVTGAYLALENAAMAALSLDGSTIPTETNGYWVDECISTMPLPPFAAGTHEIILTLPFGPATNLERIYILGDFGVDLRGRKATIVPLDLQKLGIGDYTRQGLPFYAGNVHYDFELNIEADRSQRIAIQVPRFAAPLLAVDLDGKDVGKIAFQPHTLDLGDVAPGRHTMRITAYGNRDHAFGAIHLPDGLTKWYGPDAFRTSDSWWSYEYTIREMGLLTAPRILKTSDQIPCENGWDRGSIKGYL